MSIEATATALVQDEAISAPEPMESNSEGDMRAEMDAIWDRNNAEETTEDGPEAVEEPEVAEPVEAEEATEEADTAEGKAPSELPLAVKKNWPSIPKEAQDAILETQREANRKLGDQGRLMQGISPIRDVLVEATKVHPQLADMTPKQVAQEVFTLAKHAQEFRADPVKALMALAKQHGIEQNLAQAFSGRPQTQETASMAQEIRALKQQISRFSDPEFMKNQFSSFSTEQQTTQTVEQFAASKPDWAEVENHMPSAISFVQAMAPAGISPQDVLSRAYDLALSQIKPEATKAKQPEAADEAVTIVDPERSRKALKAKSVNVSDRGGAKPKALTERQIMEQIWAKNQS